EEPVERSLVDLEELDLVGRPGGRRSWRGLQQSELAERFAATQRPDRLGVARVRVLGLDDDLAVADHGERRRTIPLPEDRLSGAYDPEVHPPGEIAEHLLGQ